LRLAQRVYCWPTISGRPDLSTSASFGDYKEALLFLTTAGVVVPLFRRLRVSPVIGFLAAGVLLGPYGLGRLGDMIPLLSGLRLDNHEKIAEVAEFGVVFLLFMIGLELSYERLMRLKKLVFGLGAAQVAVSMLAIGALAAIAGPTNMSGDFVIGGALALSSTAVVIPVLAESRRLGTTAGRAVFAVLLFQDLMVAPLLFGVSIVSQTGRGGIGAEFLYALLPAMAVLGLLIVGGRLLLRPLFHQVALTHSTEFFMATCLLVVIGTGIASASGGLSMALGAFIGGLLLSETEFRREIEVTIEPFKGLLLGLFFVSTGAGLDLATIWENPALVLGLTVALIVLKAVIVMGLARAFGLPWPAAREAAWMLGPGGEFAFVMLGAAVVGQVLAPDIASQLMIVVTLSMVAIPLLAMLTGKARKIRRSAETEADPELAARPEAEPATGHVIVIGYGRVGELVGAMLKRHERSFVAVDSDPRVVARARGTAKNVYWGDATRLEFLRNCGLETASALVVTLDAPRKVEEIVDLARKTRPDLIIVARARDAHHATKLYELGATDAIPETIEASLQLSEAVLVDIGIPMGFVIASIHEKRDEFRKLLQPEHESTHRRAIRMSTRMKTMGRQKAPEPGA
jgi:CPA2 family monovalent cation:H+ antiporter-2